MKKNHFVILLFALGLLIYPNIILAQEISIGTKHHIESKILQETREYWVYLPDSYHNTKLSPQKYPVMILLDGNAHFHAATGIVDFLAAAKKIPEMIVVGIPNTDRNRDLTPVHSEFAFNGEKYDMLKTTGGGDAFLDFLENELMPKVNSSYRTLPFRILAGHSFGGLLAIHSFLKNEGTFNAYITMDPATWFGPRFLQKELGKSESAKDYTSSLYISAANNGDTKTDTSEARKSINDFYSLLTSRSKSLRSKIRYFDFEDHSSVPLLSIYDGLVFTFQGYQIRNYNERGKEDIKEHFEKLSDNLGYPIIPPQNMLNSIGQYNLNLKKDLDTAIDFLEWNAELYPKSFITYENLGKAYMEKGKDRKAIKNFQKALELNPSSSFSKEMLEKLEKK